MKKKKNKQRVQWKKVPFLTLFLSKDQVGKGLAPQLKCVSLKSGEWLFEKEEKKYSLKKLCVCVSVNRWRNERYKLNDIFKRKVSAIKRQVSFIKVSLFLSLSLLTIGFLSLKTWSHTVTNISHSFSMNDDRGMSPYIIFSQ